MTDPTAVEAYLAHTVAACAPSCVHCARWQAEVQARADKARRRRERMKRRAVVG